MSNVKLLRISANTKSEASSAIDQDRVLAGSPIQKVKNVFTNTK